MKKSGSKDKTLGRKIFFISQLILHHFPIYVLKSSCKFKNIKWVYSMYARQHPIKAKPVKTGDAKLWVYHRENGHDRQAAEDHREYPLCNQPGLI
jgi:hypothetical protein